MKKRVIYLISIVLIVILKLYFSYAISLEKVTLVKLKDPVKFLSYNNKTVGYSMIGHTIEGIQYPAYCIEPEKPGVYETDSYDVTINGSVTDANVIKIIQNGYPYKTPSEIGVNNEQEAYYVTKAALWCYVNSRDINDYKALSNEYEYILNAMKKVYTDGLDSSNVTDAETIKINKINELKVDSKDEKYFSQVFNVESNYAINSYSVNILQTDIPEGSIITDENNTPKNNFGSNEKFKVLIPIDNIIKDKGTIELTANVSLKTQKVLFGDAPSELQDHAVTIMANEEFSVNTYTEYEKVYGRIKIIKTSSKYNQYSNKQEGSGLEGAEFTIVNKKGEIIDTVITNELGIAESKELERGEYYIKETNPPKYYLKNELQYEAKIQYKNEIIEIKVLDENIELDLDIDKHGPIEAKTEEIINYSFSNISNLSNIHLNNFSFVEIIPIDAIKVTKFNTGTWNEELKYSLKYKTNKKETEILYSDNLSTIENYTIDLTNIGLEEDEYITQIIMNFGTVKTKFKEVEMPTMEAKVESGLPNGYNFENVVKIRGEYLGEKLEEEDTIKTVIYTPIIEHEEYLPKTGQNVWLRNWKMFIRIVLLSSY